MSVGRSAGEEQLDLAFADDVSDLREAGRFVHDLVEDRGVWNHPPNCHRSLKATGAPAHWTSMRFIAQKQPAPAPTASDATGLLLSFMLAAAGLAHLSVTPAHFGEWWLFGVRFLLSTLLQLGLAAALLLRPSRAAVAAAVAVSVGLIATWVLSRTSGLPFGPDAGSPEAIGALDVLTTAIGVAFVAAALTATAPAGSPLRRSQTTCQSVGVALGIVLTVAFAGGVGHG